MKNRWDDNNLDRDGYFVWLHHWKTAPRHTVAGLQELYQQLLPTKVYHHRKTGKSGNADERCRLCGKTSGSVGHILAGCSAIAQTQYLARHNKALKILFFEIFKPHQYNSALVIPSSTKTNVREQSSNRLLGRPTVWGYHPRQGQQD